MLAGVALEEEDDDDEDEGNGDEAVASWAVAAPSEADARPWAVDSFSAISNFSKFRFSQSLVHSSPSVPFSV